MAKTSTVSSPSRFQNLSHLARIAQTSVQQLRRWKRALTSNTARTTPDPKAWRVTRDGAVILPNRKIELRARPAARRMAAA